MGRQRQDDITLDEADRQELHARRMAEWDAWFAWRAQQRRRLWFGLAKWTIIATVWGALAVALTLLWFLRDLPHPEAALDAVRRPSLIVQDNAGADIATYGDVVGEPLRLTDLPPYVPQAAVAIEDHRFWQHGPIDVLGIGRAAYVDLRDRRVAQGGSTITQQVAKTLFLSNARTWRRKVQELVLTLWLSRTFSKQEILEIWLNRVYLGQGAWGVDAAAHVYFGVSARRLSLWQAAVIAGLPRAPSRFNPRTDPAAATARAKQVLAAMVASTAISQAQADIAALEIDFSHPGTRQGGWFADWAATQAQPRIPADADAILRTTLDEATQNRAQQRLGALLDTGGARTHVTQGAVVVMDAATGAVRAMVGGRDYQQSPYNRAVAARRQPGSAFKPFIWTNALEHGARPDDAVLDAPIRIGSYAPEDFNRQYLGSITLEEALALSVNTVSVRLLLQYGGPRASAAVAARLGIADHLPNNASLALGTGEVGLLEMAAAYATFCTGGHTPLPHGTAAITANGHDIAVPSSPAPQTIAPDIADLMQQMMQAVVQRGTGTAAAIPGHTVIGKTGTTQDFRDAWFIGCVDRREIVAVWLGNDDATPMRGVDGGSLPAQLFRQIATGDLTLKAAAP